MSNGLYTQLRDILRNGDIPAKVSNRLLLQAIIENGEHIHEQTELLKKLVERVEVLERRVSHLEDNPSLIYVFRRQPARISITILILWLVLEVTAEQIVNLLMMLL